VSVRVSVSVSGTLSTSLLHKLALKCLCSSNSFHPPRLSLSFTPSIFLNSVLSIFIPPTTPLEYTLTLRHNICHLFPTKTTATQYIPPEKNNFLITACQAHRHSTFFSHRNGRHQLPGNVPHFPHRHRESLDPTATVLCVTGGHCSPFHIYSIRVFPLFGFCTFVLLAQSTPLERAHSTDTTVLEPHRSCKFTW